MKTSTTPRTLLTVTALVGSLALTGCAVAAATSSPTTEIVPAAGQAGAGGVGAVDCPATGTSVRPAGIPAPATGPYLVEKTVDGDTIRIICAGVDVRVRLIGINTPETVKDNTPVECGGPEASSYLHSRLDGAEVFLGSDPGQGAKDRYGRYLAYVWDGSGNLVNEQVLAAGHAEETGYGKPYTYSKDFKAAEHQAQAANLGRWTCP